MSLRSELPPKTLQPQMFSIEDIQDTIPSLHSICYPPFFQPRLLKVILVAAFYSVQYFLAPTTLLYRVSGNMSRWKSMERIWKPLLPRSGKREVVCSTEHADASFYNLTSVACLHISRVGSGKTKPSNDEIPPPPIILMTPPPFDPAAWKKARNVEVDGRHNEVARSYGQRVKQVGEKYGCSVLDVWETLQGDTSPDVFGKYLSDGLHLSEEGNRKVYEGLMHLISSKYPTLAPMPEGSTEGIPLEGKPWDELC